MPIADLEAQLDPKIGKKEFYGWLSADNLLDWGASGLALDAAHIYCQSEEIGVFQQAYSASRGLTMQLNADIYGAKQMVEEFCFTFAGMAQVGDILLPQSQFFGKDHSFMLSGPDQDGHMNMTTKLSEQMVGTFIKNLPSSMLGTSHL
jgi:tryptophanyl-tRNA synthetase